ncbi:M15 family metallopeptidase [Devosia ginsengisoli]|uniref:M15 family metallopeptidase n=1 Tax=Devosia ginsengisoli TaxID=400770 RepID=UPI0026EF2977|nr:M15 family metallopeptidase [Devosia ginsengisoli]MCR6672216.1 M15 family metallopeptidase [Devosia ginsengisoli]
MSNWPKQSQMAAFFGNPDTNNDGVADLKWQQDNLTAIEPPYPMFYAGKPVRKITCHVKVADSLMRILTKIGDSFTEAERKQYGLDQYGGVFNFRPKRAGTSLSTHAYACAIDLAATLNPFRAKYGSRPNMMPMAAVKIFEAEGWIWGGLWSNGDAMHFQAATIG